MCLQPGYLGQEMNPRYEYLGQEMNPRYEYLGMTS
ncbi:MAG: hypothetical protein ACI8SR_002414 [Oceanicoccus sp.]|jgi:hypothetical protein